MVRSKPSTRALLALSMAIVMGWTGVAPAGADTISGFKLAPDAFSFENYGNDAGVENLNPADVRILFGDQVCASLENGVCELTPPAEKWMEAQNKDMDGGHCYGMSIAALLFWRGVLQESDYGAATTRALPLNGNTKLQHLIARSFVGQYFDGVKAGEVKGTPTQVLDKAAELLDPANNSNDAWSLGFYKRSGDGGHEVTPVNVVEKGNGKAAIQVYDNNYPNELREITFDRNADTWSYTGSTNPSEPADEYEGDAGTKTISLTPMLATQGVQPCPFCKEGGAASLSAGARTGLAAAATAAPEVTISLDGNAESHPRLLITDPAGRQTGFRNGVRVVNIPGSELTIPRLGGVEVWKKKPEPNYDLPAGQAYSVLIDATGVLNADPSETVALGRGFDVSALNALAPGQKDILTVGADGASMTYTIGRTGVPVFELGAELDGTDYGFTVKAYSMAGGATVGLRLAADRFIIDTTKATRSGFYDLTFERNASDGEKVFTARAISLPAGVTAHVLHTSFTADGQSIVMEIRYPNGSVERRSLRDA